MGAGFDGVVPEVVADVGGYRVHGRGELGVVVQRLAVHRLRLLEVLQTRGIVPRVICWPTAGIPLRLLDHLASEIGSGVGVEVAPAELVADYPVAGDLASREGDLDGLVLGARLLGDAEAVRSVTP